MSKRLVILSLLAAAMLIGVLTSGCHRGRGPNDRRPPKEKRERGRTAQKARRQSGEDLAWASMRPSEQLPAEVLSTTVQRSRIERNTPETALPGQARTISVQPVSLRDFAGLPSHTEAQRNRGGQQYQQSAPASYSSYEDAYFAANSQNGSDIHTPIHFDGYLESPATYESPVAYASPAPAPVMNPQLTLAQASLEPVLIQAVFPSVANPQNFTVPTIEVQQFSAPIPELEPVRYRNTVAVRPDASSETQTIGNFRPMYVSQPAEVKRALSPLPAPIQASGGWIPSPVTAMRAGF